MSVVAKLEKSALRPEQELAALRDHAAGSGAIVSFIGIARPASESGESIRSLVLEHHPVLTLRSLEVIAQEAEVKFDVIHIHVVHRRGEIGIGEPIVFAGAAATHRRAAFEAADYLMDRLKTEAIFWKREVGKQGSQWIEPRAGDYADRARWG